MRPLDNPVAVVVAPSPLPAESAAPMTVAPAPLGVETRRNGRWRYGRQLRDESGGVVAQLVGGHTVIPRPDRRPGTPGVDAQLPIMPPTRTTIRGGQSTAVAAVQGGCA